MYFEKAILLQRLPGVAIIVIFEGKGITQKLLARRQRNHVEVFDGGKRPDVVLRFEFVGRPQVVVAVNVYRDKSAVDVPLRSKIQRDAGCVYPRFKISLEFKPLPKSKTLNLVVNLDLGLVVNGASSAQRK